MPVCDFPLHQDKSTAHGHHFYLCGICDQEPNLQALGILRCLSRDQVKMLGSTQFQGTLSTAHTSNAIQGFWVHNLRTPGLLMDLLFFFAEIEKAILKLIWNLKVS